MTKHPKMGAVRVTLHNFNFDAHDHIFRKAEARVAKFSTKVGYIKSQRTDDK